MDTAAPTTDRAGDIEQRQARIQARFARAELDSSQSLTQYLGHVVVNCEPFPRRWGDIWEPWQGEIAEPMIPAIEAMAGIRNPRSYKGPRSFFIVLPRGHDKTGLIGRVANWTVGFGNADRHSRGRVRNRVPLKGVVAASSREQAALTRDSMEAEINLNPWMQQRVSVNNYKISGDGGSLKVISSDADHSSGFLCDFFILDELTFWEKPDLFRVLWSGREKRSRSVFIIITNAGLVGTWQHKIYLEAKQSHDWVVYEAPAGRMLASWMTPERINENRRMLEVEKGRGFARRVFDNEWIEATERPLLTWELIVPCKDSGCLWAGGVPPHHNRHRPELYIGIDFGRTRDRTVIWIGELVGDVVWTRVIRVLEGMPFAEQEEVIRQILREHGRNVVAVRLDKGAQGYVPTENLERDYPRICEGVHLSQGKQGQLGVAFKNSFERHRIRVPDDPELTMDLQRVEEADTANGTPRISTERGPEGHGDRFWAGALMMHGVPETKQRQRGGLPRGMRAAGVAG